MNTLETDVLAELVRNKHDLLTQLRDLGRHQADFIEADELGQLLKVLAAKQRLLAALQTVEQRLHPFRDQDPERRVWRSPDDRQRCAQMASRCSGMLAEVMQQERESEHLLAGRREQVRMQLDGAHHSSAARGAYLATSHAAPSQLDLSSDT